MYERDDTGHGGGKSQCAHQLLLPRCVLIDCLVSGPRADHTGWCDSDMGHYVGRPTKTSGVSNLMYLLERVSDFVSQRMAPKSSCTLRLTISEAYRASSGKSRASRVRVLAVSHAGEDQLLQLVCVSSPSDGLIEIMHTCIYDTEEE